MILNLSAVIHAVLDEYVLPWQGDHGVAHWARVLVLVPHTASRLASAADTSWRALSICACCTPSELLATCCASWSAF